MRCLPPQVVRICQTRVAAVANRRRNVGISCVACGGANQYHQTSPLFSPTPSNNIISFRSFHITAANTRFANRLHDGRERRRNNDATYDSNNNEGSYMKPSYITNLERRAEDHIQNFPAITSSSDNPNNDVHDDNITALLSPWNRTTVEIIMLMSKLWSTKQPRTRKKYQHNHHSSDQMQMFKFVSLSNDLLKKTLLIKEKEIDAVFLIESNNNDDSESTNSKKPPRMVRQSGSQLNTEILCQTVALGWSRCDQKLANNAALKSQSILEQLESICSKRACLEPGTKVTYTLHDVTPSIRLYNHVLTCWSRSFHPDAEMHAKKLLHRMTNSDECTYARPDRYSYNNMLNLYANKGDVTAVEALLHEMETTTSNNNQVPSPDVYSYSIAMNAFQKRFTSSEHTNRNMKDPERAEELLSRLVTKYEKSNFRNDTLCPTNVTFSTVMAMYAQSDRVLKNDRQLEYGNRTRKWRAQNMALNSDNKDVGRGAKNAERVLDWMIGLNERERRSKGVNFDGNSVQIASKNDEFIRPSTHNFVTVMDAWAKAGKGVVGAERCERLLDRLISLYDKLGYNELHPNPMCFGTVLDSWAKADNKYETAEKAELVLGRMEDLFLHRRSSNPKEVLSNIAYNLVIDAWSRRSGADTAERAENILRRLLNNYELTKNRFLRPDVITYTAVMKSYVNKPNGGEKAIAILEEMNNEYENGNARAIPDVKALSVAMDACAKSGLTEEAERILNDVDDSQKNAILFNTIMSGYKSEGRGEGAEAILRRMINLEQSGFRRCSPDMISYTLCIEAWGNSTSDEKVARSRALLDESITRYQNGNNSCKPSNVTFNATASCISNCDDPDRVTQVLSLFETMEAIGLEPELVSFNILLKTCATAIGRDEEKRNALQIAASTFNSISTFGLRADCHTYASMIRVMVNLMENSVDRTRAIAGIFRQCCEDGCVNQNIMDTLFQTTSKDQFLAITGISLTDEKKDYVLSNLPTEWTYRAT